MCYYLSKAEITAPLTDEKKPNSKKVQLKINPVIVAFQFWKSKSVHKSAQIYEVIILTLFDICSSDKWSARTVQGLSSSHSEKNSYGGFVMDCL